MHTILFRYEPESKDATPSDARTKFNATVYTWGRTNQSDKINSIFGAEVKVSSPIISQTNTVFEIKLSTEDEKWIPAKTISSEDLAIAMGLNPSEWTVWKMM